MTLARLIEAEGRTAMRKALCKRLRETGMQAGDPCDGDTVQCGCCDRTISAILRAMEGRDG